MNRTPSSSIARSSLRSTAPANGLGNGVSSGCTVDHRSARALRALEVRESALASILRIIQVSVSSTTE